jgi:hypothetical protein
MNAPGGTVTAPRWRYKCRRRHATRTTAGAGTTAPGGGCMTPGGPSTTAPGEPSPALALAQAPPALEAPRPRGTEPGIGTTAAAQVRRPVDRTPRPQPTTRGHGTGATGGAGASGGTSSPGGTQPGGIGTGPAGRHHPQGGRNPRTAQALVAAPPHPARRSRAARAQRAPQHQAERSPAEQARA